MLSRKWTIAIWQLQNRLLSGSNARHFSTECKSKITRGHKIFDERIINFITIQKQLLEFACLFTNCFHRIPTKLDKCWYFGSGKFEFGQWKVREKSGNFTFYNLWEPCICYSYFYFYLKCSQNEHRIFAAYLINRFKCMFEAYSQKCSRQT